MNPPQKKPAPRKEKVRTPPSFLLAPRECSPEYIEACKPYVLVVETDGFGVIPHNP